MIHPLSGEVSHRLCTGQIIISLSNACRELIDNALDAGATNIVVNVKENGTMSLEVNDNGSGIDEIDFSALCKAHATSKLSSFRDFSMLSTFGFRGEALNALAALSDITILTKHVDAQFGTMLKFNHNGEIISREIAPRPNGTTVIVENLFKSLPVRRKEFVRNSKKEFLKMLNVINTFAISRCDLKFLCSNIVNNKRIVMISTPGGTANIIDVCGALFGVRSEKGSLLEIAEGIPNEEIKAIYSLPENQDERVFYEIKIIGYVSSCEVGQGRHSSDRQFVYVNKRPVDYSKICKIANSIYQQFNRGQYPMLVVFIEVDPSALDVNISPDKRTVLFHAEKPLFAKFHASLLKTFSKVLGSCHETPSQARKPSETRPSLETSHSFSLATIETTENMTPIQPRKKKLSEESYEFTLAKRDCRETNNLSESGPRLLTLENFAFKSTKPSGLIDHNPKLDEGLNDARSEPNMEVDVRTMKVNMHRRSTDENSQQVATDTDFFIEKEFRKIEYEMGMEMGIPRPIFEPKDEILDEPIEPTSSDASLRPQQVLFVDFRKLRHTFQNRPKIRERSKFEHGRLRIEKSTDILDETQPDEVAEEHLRMMLKKEDFAKMEVIGQFNNAFIFARLNDRVFMIDQHAADEKYNFEQFQKRARVQTQKLIDPQPLELGALQESVLRDNIDIFRYNGFDFSFDKDQARLTAVPGLLGWQFDRNDIDEILGVLSDFPGVMYRPAKLRKLFASRACRKSIMFGDPLNRQQFESIVRNLGSLDQPWNCPHGRPTIRHLCNMKIDRV